MMKARGEPVETLRERYAGTKHISPGMLTDLAEAEALVAAGHWRKRTQFQRDSGWGDFEWVDFDPETGLIDGIHAVPDEDNPEIWLATDGPACSWRTAVFYESLDPARVRPAEIARRVGEALLTRRDVVLYGSMSETEVCALIAEMVDHAS